MDLEEWEFIPDDGILEIQDDGENKIFSRKYVKNSPKTFFDMNYFICPSQKSEKFVESAEDSRVVNQLVPLPIHLQHNIQKSPDYEPVEEINIEPSEFTEAENYMGVVPEEETEQDSVSQIFFKKMKENEFDMKMDSPKSTSKGIWPQIEARSIKEGDEMVAWEESNGDGSVNLWKWSLTGIGAICSFGVAAAATICCIIILGPKNKQYQQNHQKLRFQIYADDKRMKEVVQQKSSRVNDAVSAARGIPLTGAHITFGGYYDGL